MPIDPNRMMSEHPNMTDLLLWLYSCVGENNDGLCPAVFSAEKKHQLFLHSFCAGLEFLDIMI